MPRFRLLILTVSIFCFSAFPALASDCTAPVLHYQLKGFYPGGWFGQTVANVGDLNGDNVPDFMVSAPLAKVGTLSQAGSVYAYSGLDGSLLYQLNGSIVAEHFGGSYSGSNHAIAGIGDINGDGRSDFVVGAPDANYAAVFSGADGDSLYKIWGDSTTNSLGHTVAGTEDINGDQIPDFIIGSSRRVFVFSGADGTVLFEKTGAPGHTTFGWSIAGPGDINGDNKPDLLIGEYFALNPDISRNTGATFAYSGLDSSLLYQRNGSNSHDLMGWSVAGCGDLDGDGNNDFITSAPSFDNYYCEDFGPSFAYVFSGATGDLLFEKTAGPSDAFGLSVDGGGDVNGDGNFDFIVGAPGEFSTSRCMEAEGAKKRGAYVYSGTDGELIFQITNPLDFPYYHLGWSVAFAGDVNGDGKTDVILGDPGLLVASHQDSGAAYVYVSKTVPKGDLNFDSTLTIADITNLLNVVFIDSSSAISPCTADLNCDGASSPADIILLLNRVFLQTALPCS
ncbi:MAG TPA: FG-GAP-like repeat-containing protein [Verrucomicrobiae bacterium]|nr:FG-GAP-like repeat-containing protein [Verrucomicrobiae bacterium]